MDSTKNFFDAWMNTQSKIVDNLLNTSKTLRDNLTGGTPTETINELYQTWFNKQQNLLDTVMTSFKENFDTQGGTPAFFKEWVDAQTKFGQTWLESIRNTAADFSGMENNGENLKKMFENWSGIYNQMFNQFGKPLDNLNYMPGNMTKDAFSDLFNNTRTYMQMFELWQPIYKMIQSNTLGVDALSKMMDMDKYKDVLGGMFQFMNPQKGNMMQEQLKKYAEYFMGGSPFNMSKNPFGNQMEQFYKFMQPQSTGTDGLGMLFSMNQQISEQFNQSINPYFTMMPAGREKDMLKLFVLIQEKYVKYYIKASEMQNFVYTSGQKSIEKVVKEMMGKVSENAQVISFDDFYTQWLNTTERDMITLFNSPTFSKMQGELLNIGLDIKAHLDKEMELALAPFPVVPRSEVDEINKTLYELKKKVRELENIMLTNQKTTKNQVAETTQEVKTETIIAKTQEKPSTTASKKPSVRKTTKTS